MFIKHKITPDTEGVATPVYVIYDAPQDCDIAQVIHDAALDYCLAAHPDDDNVTGMSYMDFLQQVPTEYCEKYGVKKMVMDDDVISYSGKSLCLTSHEIKRQLADRKRAAYQNTALHKAFSAFGRRLEPALRKSPADRWTFYHITKWMLAWSEEFADAATGVDAYGQQERRFVDEKLSLLKRPEMLEPPPEDAAEQTE